MLSTPAKLLIISAPLWLMCALILPHIGITYAALNETESSSSSSNVQPAIFNINSHVPLFISNISISATTTTAASSHISSTAPPSTASASNSLSKDIVAVNINTQSAAISMNSNGGAAAFPSQKVPLRRNATEQNAASAFVQTPASVFFANYNNQQNVLQLVRNIDTRMRVIRNVEMRVATIQEIFDSLHFSSSSISNTNNKNSSDLQQQNVAASLQQDLQIFSKRLTKKLQKAKHVVIELRDFFRFNITKLVQQQHLATTAEYSEDDDTDTEIEDAADDVDEEDEEFNAEIDNVDEMHNTHLYLHTYIQAFQVKSDVAQEHSTELNYNKQQIQILNYLKTEPKHTHSHSEHYLHYSDDYLIHRESLEARANAYIVEKVQTLKNTLMNSDTYELPLTTLTLTTTTNGLSANAASNAKLKFLGNHFKHIYFLSRSDHASDRIERYYYDQHFRHLYVSAIKYKYMFLLLDVGATMNVELLELTKTFVSNVLQLLSPTDLISVVTVAEEAHSMQLDAYTGDMTTGVYYATRTRKDEILNYIHSLSVTKTQTNHSLGFEYGFSILEKLQNATVITPQTPIQFVYVTRGLLTNLSEAMHVLQVIARGQRQLRTPVVIHTCAVVLDEKRIMYEKQFLTDIATQNYTKFDIPVSDWYGVKVQPSNLVGKFFVLTKMQSDVMMRTSTAIFENAFRERYLSDSLEVHPPVVDTSSHDTIVSITHAIAPYGVVGVNLYLADLIEDVVNYRHSTQNANKNDLSYAFLIDRSGMTIAHPAFPRPMTQSQTPFPVDIGFLENSTDFAQIRRQMLHSESGNLTTTVYLMQNRKLEPMERLYHWQSVLGIYVLCLVSTFKREPPVPNSNNTNTDNAIKSAAAAFHMPTRIPLTLQRYNVVKDNMPHFQQTDYEYLSSVDLLYHRLDLIPPANSRPCRYFRQIATMDAPTLFLSAAAFESPFTFLHNNRVNSPHTQIRTVESIMAYIKDSTGLLANPGLRPQIRHEVNALYNAMQHLKKRHQDARGTLKNYIIRRYIATVNGVLQVYPGCLLSSNYDPTRRPWFRKAMQQPGKIITTEPYLDAGGAGYIITIAHTIFEGKANALHSVERDEAVAIVALDLPYAYYYKMILDTTPLCQLKNIKCLLFENEGYLIAHPSMQEPSTLLRNQRRPHEHLTHKESYLANDILNHKSLVRKLACANYQNRTLQRYYVFNTSLTDILTNVVHGERTKYAIALVRGSNIFAAVLNSTCDGGAFCPCSTIDRICLNCNRMDQMDCECPCECPMEMDVFGSDTEVAEEEPFRNYTQQYAYCEPPSEHFIALPPIAESQLLHSCININCDVYGTQSECLAIMGCEWCQQDMDGNSFTTSFCAAQASCFNGVLSSLTPYGDLDDVDIIAAHGYNPGQKQNSYSAFGPVGGAIVVLGIVIGFAIYCYRHNLDTHAQDQFYIDSMQEENYGLPLSRFNFDDCQAHDEPPGSGGYDHPSAQRNLIHPADISPYHMSTGSSYRRPPNGESDHGYSTMTPHEDSSDHQCFTLAEPLLLHDKRNSKSDTMSISTSISSPTNRHHQPNYNNPYLNHPPVAPTQVLCSSKDAARYNLTSPKKFHASIQQPSPARGGVYEQTTLPLHDSNEDCGAMAPHYILAPVTVHRHMETTES